MKDGLGSTIEVGSRIVWVGGKTKYAGVSVYEVKKITAKRVGVHTGDPHSDRLTFIDPTCVLVVDILLDQESIKKSLVDLGKI